MEGNSANLALEKTLMLGIDRASSPSSVAHWQGKLTHPSPSIVTEQTEETRNPLSSLSQPDYSTNDYFYRESLEGTQHYPVPAV